RDQGIAVDDDGRLLVRLAHSSMPRRGQLLVGRVGIEVVVLDLPAWEHPHAAEGAPGAATQHEYFESVDTVTCEHDRRRRDRLDVAHGGLPLMFRAGG